MTNLDLSGRTNGAGTHTWIAGVEYVWVVNDQGRLELQRVDRAEFNAQIRRLAVAAGFTPVDSDPAVQLLRDIFAHDHEETRQ